MPTPLVVSGVAKSFTMHLRDGIRLPVVAGVSFSIRAGECAVLGGPSGAGKSSMLKMLYGNYAVDEGQIIVQHEGGLIDLAIASPRTVLSVRRQTIGYVSQFLRTVPRVSALDVVAEPLVERGEDRESARKKARTLLGQLNCRKSSGRCRRRLSRAVSSSASISRAASSPSIRSCCSTSRQLRSIRKTATLWLR
ncbi:ATP-binding cassette domain-containing protein [Mesorhizobium sp. M0078]|uniref:ATP-binding cassette domain-containing protein n=1 Tax=Mesorhizobium sp. M0078 TaxID=2956871 RepID=UPI0033362988